MIVQGTEIDASRARCRTSENAIRQAGLSPIRPEDNPPLVWIDGILTNSEAAALLDYQRVNKIPCMDFLCYKSTLFSELNAIRAHFPRLFEFYPHTYLLPDELPEFQREHTFICGRTATSPVWVIKPKSGCCGRGIHFIQSVQEAEAVASLSVAQLLVNPCLLNERKFDFRFFLLISSLEPFAAFIYREGIARFCTQSYIVPTKANLDHPFSHLTNTAINKMSDADPDEFTRPASEVLREVIARYAQAANVWEKICEVSVLTLAGLFPSILACLPANGGAVLQSKLIDQNAPKITIPRAERTLMYLKTGRDYPFIGAVQRKKPVKKKKKGTGKKAKKGVKRAAEPDVEATEPVPEAPDEPEPPEQPNPKERVLTQAQKYFHIVGIDIILDAKCQPKVLELNDRPSLQVTAPFEEGLKEGLIAESFLHLSLDGSSFGNHPNSNWQQILPVSPSSELAAPIRAMMQHKSDLKYHKKTGLNSVAAQRMMEAGVKSDLHDYYRTKFVSSVHSSALPPMKDELTDEIG
jgi:hypothetical protein